MKNILKVFLVVFSLSILLGVFCDEISHHENWRKLPEDICGLANTKSQERFPWTARLLYKSGDDYVYKPQYNGHDPNEEYYVKKGIYQMLSFAAMLAIETLAPGKLTKEAVSYISNISGLEEQSRQRKAESERIILCGGVLLNQVHVLTVAYCVDGILLEELKGVQLLGSHHSATEDFAIKKVIPHGGFTEARREYNIALIVLEKPARISEYIKPICFPRKLIYPDDDRYETATLIGPKEGFNYSEVSLSSSHVGIENCQKEFPFPLNNGEICVVKPLGQNTCPGTIMKMNGTDRYVLMGLDAPIWCGLFRHKVYTNVTYFTKWVLDNLE